MKNFGLEHRRVKMSGYGLIQAKPWILNTGLNLLVVAIQF